MSNVVRFPIDRRLPATTIPRAEFERLAGLALDVVEQIITLLDEQDGDADGEGKATPSLCAKDDRIAWLHGNECDLEL